VITRRLIPFALLSITACEPPATPQGVPTPPPVEETPAPDEVPFVESARYPARAANGLAEIHFTRPGVERDMGEDPEIDDEVAKAIDAAEFSVDLCLYEFGRPNIFEAAIAAHQRGVEVRFVGDGDEYHDEGYEALAAAGIELVMRKPLDRIMHNKFVVIDAQWVFSGSMNYSQNGILRNNNHTIRYESADLADIYAAEFQQMYDEILFGRKKESLGIGQSTTLGQSDIEIYFSPQDDPIQALRRAVATTDTRLFFMIFSFTHPDLVDDLIALHESGVEVVGVFDESQARGRYSVDERLAQAGVPVYIDGNKNAIGFAGGKLHHKTMLIDPATLSEPLVVSGSFNWSNAATRYNDENLVILHGTDFATPFLEEFCKVLEVATLHPDYDGEDVDPCATLLVSVRINEALPNPDGRDTDREFVELVNGGAAPFDLEGWTLSDIQKVRHTFTDTVLAPGASLVIWSGQDPDNPDAPPRLVASSGDLGLTNSAETLTLRDADGVVVDQVKWTGAPSGISANRSPDGSAESEFVWHDTLSDFDQSPGRRIDDTLWPGEPLIVINELLANPIGSDAGNEYIELVNQGTGIISLRDWTLWDAQRARHVFGDTVLQPGEVVTVFDRGDHDDIDGAQNSSSSVLSLNNSGDTITLRNPAGDVLDRVVYGRVDEGIALNRERDGDPESPMVNHDTLDPDAPRDASPGKRFDGTFWVDPPPLLKIVINEVLPNPVGADADNEYVELVNIGEAEVNLAGYALGDAVSDDRHVFGGGEVLGVGESLVIFDGGEHPDVPGSRIASSGGLSLNNGGDAVNLFRPDGTLMDGVFYDASSEGMALNRAFDADPFTSLVPHVTVDGASGNQSPGKRVDGTDW
jgi:phosphatidylserine/phosphatidylglycerophosphate/cardiolipin synthase-like enzyme